MREEDKTRVTLECAKEAINGALELFNEDGGVAGTDKVRISMQLIGHVVQLPPDGNARRYDSTGETTTIIVLSRITDKIIGE